MGKVDQKDIAASLEPINETFLKELELRNKHTRLTLDLSNVAINLNGENHSEESVKALEERIEQIKQGVNEFALELDQLSQEKAKQTEKKK